VKNGDSLWRVARKFNVKIADLKSANSLKTDVVHPGMVLKIPTVERNGLKLHPQPGSYWVYETREGDSLVDLAVKLEIPLILLVQANEIEQVYELPAGIFLRVPLRDLTTRAPASSSARPSGDSPLYQLPVKGEVVSPFGWRLHPIHKEMKIHTGIDIRARYGQPIRASRAGKVVLSEWIRGYGKTIDIRHSDGLVTRYAHCSKLVKKQGEWVRQNDVIGNVGSTGLATGPHMHFEVRRRGRPLNPMRYLSMAQL
jgi:murein DD-endopeptidase MepM/ murein hydrolase activator NlpD